MVTHTISPYFIVLLYALLHILLFFLYALLHIFFFLITFVRRSLMNIVIIEFPTSLSNGQPIQAVRLRKILPCPEGGITDLREFAVNAHEYGNATKVAIYQIGNVFIMISIDNTSLHGDRLMNLVRLGCHKKDADANPNVASGVYGQGGKLSQLYGSGTLIITTTKITNAYGRISFLITGEFLTPKGDIENQSTLMEFELIELQNGDLSVHCDPRLVTLDMIEDLNMVMRALGMVEDGEHMK